MLSDTAPGCIWSGARMAVGRYRRPIARPDVERRGPALRLKQWCYQSFATPEVFCAFAIVGLGYAAQAFAYVVDRSTGHRASFEALSPLGLGVSFVESSLSGSTRFRRGQASITAGYERGFSAHFSLPLDDGSIAALEVTSTPDDALALVFPLSAERAAYTHKAAGMRARGTLHWGKRRYDLGAALATLDFTRSLADRHTRWEWASFVGHTASGRRFGLNLSAHVYDDAHGDSTENGVWLDGVLHTLGGVRFDMTLEPLRISSRDGSGEVELVVRPLGARRSRLDLHVIRSTFTQPYGTASGQVRGERVEGAFGVVEEHDALW